MLSEHSVQDEEQLERRPEKSGGDIVNNGRERCTLGWWEAMGELSPALVVYELMWYVTSLHMQLLL